MEIEKIIKRLRNIRTQSLSRDEALKILYILESIDNLKIGDLLASKIQNNTPHEDTKLALKSLIEGIQSRAPKAKITMEGGSFYYYEDRVDIYIRDIPTDAFNEHLKNIQNISHTMIYNRNERPTEASMDTLIQILENAEDDMTKLPTKVSIKLLK